jgi:predicted small lipoprotein YifL
MSRLLTGLLALGLLTMTACGSGKGPDPQPDAAVANTAPSFVAGWTERPTLRQGTELLLTDFTVQDAEGDDFSITVNADPSGFLGY